MKNPAIIMLIMMIVLLIPQAASADNSRIAVLYPETTGSYEQVFSSMIEGIQQTKDAQVLPRQVANDPDIPEINLWLRENRIQSVIILGSVSYKIRDQLPASIPVIVGAMVVSPDGFSGISLAGDPGLFLKNLQELSPRTKRVFVVYSKNNSGWLIDLAKADVKARGIELVAHEADDIKQGLEYYDEILANIGGVEDAVWMPLDNVIPDRAILPKLLKAAWDKKFVVFSNNPLHVKKGVLFALYPDHILMGKNLGEMAVSKIPDVTHLTVIPAKQLKIAVNKRTASHLNLNFSKNLERSFSIVFPSE